VGVIHGGWFAEADDVGAVPHDALFDGGLLQPFDGLLSIALDRILYLNFHHQMAAALEIEPQANVIFHIGDQFSFRCR